MSKFKKKKSGGLPPMSTAALPDIVFMLLFFFMVAASLKSENPDAYIEFTKPKASELTKIEDKDIISSIYLGKPKAKFGLGDEHRLLINDKFSKTSDIRAWVTGAKSKLGPKKRNKFIADIVVDVDAPMGTVSDIKQALRQANVTRVSYSSDKITE